MKRRVGSVSAFVPQKGVSFLLGWVQLIQSKLKSILSQHNFRQFRFCFFFFYLHGNEVPLPTFVII